MPDTQLQTSGIGIQNRSLYVNELYTKYGAMLLGYIFEVVKNMTVAEQYLVDIFKDVPHEFDLTSKTGAGTFCQLQLIARKKLSGFFESKEGCATPPPNTNNKFVAFMNPEQQLVFCGVYWHGKTIASLATELEKSEDAVRKLLKECFTTIRRESSK